MNRRWYVRIGKISLGFNDAMIRRLKHSHRIQSALKSAANNIRALHCREQSDAEYKVRTRSRHRSRPRS